MASEDKPERRPRLDRRSRAARAQGRGGREALLEAAAALFARRGFRETSIDDIAREAGFSKGAVYWHFESKDDLFFALVEQRIDRPLRAALAELESAPAERDMAPVASEVFVALVEGQHDLVLLDREYWSLAVRDPQLRARYAKRQAEIRRAFARALEARIRHLGAPVLAIPMEQLAAALLGLANGLALERLVDRSAVPDDLLGEMFAVFYAGLVARGQRPGPVKPG